MNQPNDARDWDTYRRPHADRVEVDFGGVNDDSDGGVVADDMLRSARDLLGPVYKLFDGAIGLLLQSPEEYAKRIVPLLFTPELEGRSGVLFNRLGKPVLPSKGFDEACVARFTDAATGLLDRALARSVG